MITSFQPCCRSFPQLCKPRAIPKLALQLPQAELSTPPLMPRLSLECRLNLQNHREGSETGLANVCARWCQGVNKEKPGGAELLGSELGCSRPHGDSAVPAASQPSGMQGSKPGGSAALSFFQTPAESPPYKLLLLPRSQTLTIHSYLLRFFISSLMFLFFSSPCHGFSLFAISVPYCIASLGFKKGWRANGCFCNPRLWR